MADRPHGRPFIPYEIPLSDSERVRLVLPADLTQAEADRICGVIQTLAFAVPEDHGGTDAGVPRT